MLCIPCGMKAELCHLGSTGMYKLICFLAFSLMVATSSASIFKGKIISIGTGPHYDGICTAETCAVVMVDGTTDTGYEPPACQNGSWNYILRTDNESGKNTLSQLLTSFVAGLDVAIGAKGVCTLDVNDNAEEINYIYFKYK